MKKSAFIILLLVLIMLLAACGYSWYTGYNNCINTFLSTRPPGQDAQQIYNFVTVQKFEQFRYLLMLYSFIAFLALANFNRIYGFVSVQLGHIAGAVVSGMRLAFRSDFKYLLIIPLLTSFYYAITMPINFDEALTWMWFTSKGLLSSAGYYPAPNNHILHSLITCFTRYIPFIWPLLRLRISSLIAGAFILIIGNAMLSKHFNKQTALVVVGISSMLFMSLYYGYMARGYALLGLFFISAFYAALNIINGQTDNKNFTAFGLASVLGFYTMPSFLYAFVMLNAIVFLCNPKAAFKTIVTGCITGGVVLLLYLPVIIINGVGALINNPYVAPLGRAEVAKMLPQFTPAAVHEITGIGALYFVPLLAISFLLLLKEQKRNYLIVFIVFLTGPFALVLLHAVIRYSRTFSYYTFMLVFLVVLSWRNLLQQIKINYLLPVIVVLQLVLLNNFSSQIYNYENFGLTAERVLQSIAGNKSYFCDEPLFEITLQFKLRTGGYNYQFNDTRNVPLCADTMPGFDYVVIRKEWDQTQIRVPQIKTEYYNVYEWPSAN